MGNDGIFLTMGNAGFISSTVSIMLIEAARLWLVVKVRA